MTTQLIYRKDTVPRVSQYKEIIILQLHMHIRVYPRVKIYFFNVANLVFFCRLRERSRYPTGYFPVHVRDFFLSTVKQRFQHRYYTVA